MEIHKISLQNLTSWDKISPFSSSDEIEDDIISNSSSHSSTDDFKTNTATANTSAATSTKQIKINIQDQKVVFFEKDNIEHYKIDCFGKNETIIHQTPPFSINHQINEKIIFWIGDVWRLDTDVIIYPNNTQLSDRDGIAGPIFSYGGREILNDIKRNGSECRIGESMLTGAGKLPTRFVIHSNCPTYNPKYLSAAENALNSCYRSSLECASEQNLKTLGLACIHNDTKHFPPVLGAHIALRTIRRYLEQYGFIEKIVLALVNIIDIEIYKKLLPIYFPRTEEELIFQQKNLPKEYGDKNGELVSEDRKIRIKSIFRNFDDDYIEDEDEINSINPFSNNLSNSFSSSSGGEEEYTFISKKDDPDILKKKKLMDDENEKDNPLLSTLQYYISKSKTMDFSSLENSNFMYKTTDSSGQQIIVIVGSNLDKKQTQLDYILTYFIKTLESLNISNITYQPFSIIYFHSGTSSRPLPEITWFKSLLELFEYRYSKYLRSFNVVHPSFFLKASFLVLKAFSKDVMDKLVYHDNLNNLKSTIRKLNLPKTIFASEIKRNNITDYAFIQDDHPPPAISG